MARLIFKPTEDIKCELEHGVREIILNGKTISVHEAKGKHGKVNCLEDQLKTVQKSTKYCLSRNTMQIDTVVRISDN